MKMLLLATALLLPLASQANVKRNGEFVPSACSYEKSDRISPSIVAVKSVCWGHIEGLSRDAVQIQTNDGEERVYSVKLERSLRGMGSHKSPFEGSTVSSRVRDEISGVFSMTSGITVTYGVSFKTASNLSFKGPLRQVFVPQ